MLTKTATPIPPVGQLKQGDAFKITFTIVDVSGNPVDITGQPFKWRMFSGNIGSFIIPHVLEKTIGSGISLTDPTNGKGEISIDNTDTLNKIGAFYHECEMNQETTTFIGNILFSPSGILD